MWPVERLKTDKQTNRQTDKQTDRQTDKQTDRGDQYTFRKSKISKSNKQTHKQTWALQYLALPLWGAR